MSAPEPRMPQVDGEIGQRHGEIHARGHPLLQAMDRKGVAQIVETRSVPPSAVRDPRRPQGLAKDAVDRPRGVGCPPGAGKDQGEGTGSGGARPICANLRHLGAL